MDRVKDLPRRPWALLLSLLLSLLLLPGLLPSAAAADLPADGITLRVAYFPLSGFFEYDETGAETGYGVEVLDKIAQYTGLSFTYVPAGSWAETQTLLTSGQADIRMPGTQPRTLSTLLTYTQHSIIDTYYAIMALRSRVDLVYEDHAVLPTLRYGISQNLYQQEASISAYLASADIPESQLVFFDDYDACRAALARGDVDAVISNIMDLDNEMSSLARFTTVSNYISLPAGSPYASVINDALSSIKLEEPTFFSDLYKEYYPERVSVPLTKAESDYLRSLESLRFAFPNGQGFLSRRDEDGTFVGFYPLLAQTVCQRLGVVCQPVERTAAGDLIYPDFCYDRAWADAWELDITKSYLNANYYQISRKGSAASDQDCRVAAVQELRITQTFLQTLYQPEQLLWYETAGDCIEAVNAGQADVTYVNSYAAEYYLNLYRYNNLTTVLSDYSNRICFGVRSEDSALLASALNKVMQSITSAELEALLTSCTSQSPQQDLLTEWIYTNPIRSTLLVSSAAGVVIVLLFLFIFTAKARKKNAQLLKATNAKQDFLSRMSHDMRTPMNTILSFSSFGAESTSLEESQEFHRKVHKAGEYLLQLVNDSLDLSKLTARRGDLHLTPVRRTELLDAVCNIVLPRAQEKGITFTTSCTPEAIHSVLLFDRARLEQILVNLLNNAIKYTPAGGSVSLDIDLHPPADGYETVVFHVRDNGIGMSEAFQQEKLFRPFEQEHPDNAEGGTGLGLSIVKQLVDAMGGTVSCVSAQGRGSTFTVTLRGKVAPETCPGAAETAAKPVDLTGKRILLCEDHPLNRDIARRLLEKRGMLVEDAENGLAGYDLFTKSPFYYYDAVLMDIRMPVMDGLTAARAIRSTQRADAAIPILAISANAFEEDVSASRKAGMDAHLSKPIDPPTLYRTLESCLRPKTP